MKKIDILRAGLKLTGGIAVSQTIDMLIKQNICSMGKFDKVCVKVGTFVIGMAASEFAERYIAEWFDATMVAIDNVRGKQNDICVEAEDSKDAGEEEN